MMGRLTERDSTGVGICGGTCGFFEDCGECAHKNEMIGKLAAYEDTGLSPGQVEELAKLSDPLPVKHERTFVGDYRCPKCNAAFYARWEQPSGIATKPKELAGTTQYCGNCGQHLRWTD